MQNQPSVKIHYFLEQLQSAHLAARTLEISFERSKEIIKRLKKNPQSELRIEEEEILEAMTSRFARLADLMIQKLARGLDAIELSDEGSLLDRLSRMEKRGLISQMQDWVTIREIRNEIAHEYILKDLRNLQLEVFNHTPPLMECLTSIQAYAQAKNWLQVPGSPAD